MLDAGAGARTPQTGVPVLWRTPGHVGVVIGHPNAKGGCCGKPVGCRIDSKGCVHKVEKREWQKRADEAARTAKSGPQIIAEQHGGCGEVECGVCDAGSQGSVSATFGRGHHLADAAMIVESMCHWRYDEDKGTDPAEQHMAYHFGRWPGQTGVCPYEAMAAVLRGKPDPRDSRRLTPDRAPLDFGEASA